VLPGEELKVSGLRPGFGTYREDGRLYASVMGLLSARPPFARVIPLAGRYIPQKDDLVLGVVQSVGPTYWLLDIRAPHFTPLHVSGVPWQLDYGETVEYLRPGETVLVRVEGLDENRRVGVSMNGPNLGKLEGGYLVEISPSKVPRVIGKGGSMIQLIQGATGARLVVGQNGRVWVEGGPDQIRKVREVLQLIDEEGQRRGLTDRVKALLASHGPRGRGSDASFQDQPEEEKE
jgi:exosome complex component RRP4